MKKINDKQNYSDKEDGVLKAEDFNSLKNEIENSILKSKQDLNENSINQLEMAIRELPNSNILKIKYIDSGNLVLISGEDTQCINTNSFVFKLKIDQNLKNERFENIKFENIDFLNESTNIFKINNLYTEILDANSYVRGQIINNEVVLEYMSKQGIIAEQANKKLKSEKTYDYIFTIKPDYERFDQGKPTYILTPLKGAYEIDLDNLSKLSIKVINIYARDMSDLIKADFIFKNTKFINIDNRGSWPDWVKNNLKNENKFPAHMLRFVDNRDINEKKYFANLRYDEYNSNFVNTHDFDHVIMKRDEKKIKEELTFFDKVYTFEGEILEINNKKYEKYFSYLNYMSRDYKLRYINFIRSNPVEIKSIIRLSKIGKSKFCYLNLKPKDMDIDKSFELLKKYKDKKIKFKIKNTIHRSEQAVILYRLDFKNDRPLGQPRSTFFNDYPASDLDVISIGKYIFLDFNWPPQAYWSNRYMTFELNSEYKINLSLEDCTNFILNLHDIGINKDIKQDNKIDNIFKIFTQFHSVQESRTYTNPPFKSLPDNFNPNNYYWRNK